MRNVQHIWDAWASGLYIGDYEPCTRVTVEKSYELRTTGAVVGQWKKGPARWFQRYLTSEQIETELPNLETVTISRGLDQDAGTCDIAMANVRPQAFGEPPVLAGQYGDLGYYTFDHGASPESRARWGHTQNPWYEVLVPNALIRVYQGFGGHAKTLDGAVEDGNLVLNGIFLVDSIDISTTGTIHIKCRDMAKLLIDQEIFPPLVPTALYPLKYMRYTYAGFKIPADPPPTATHEIITAMPSDYGSCGPAPHSSTDEFYGELDTGQTGHAPSEAFDWSSNDPPNAGPGQIAHQRTYWLSEPKAAPTDDVWIEFCVDHVDVNMIYFHPWAGNYQVKVSVLENGDWVEPEAGGHGGITPEGIPYVSSFTSNWEGGQPPGLDPNSYYLPRTYRADRIRLTVSNLVAAQEGGFRAGARKIMAMFDKTAAQYPSLTFTSAALPFNMTNNTGYWQVRSNGRLYAFGDARTYPVSGSSPFPNHVQPVIGMTAHPLGTGYWTVDFSGRVIAYGVAVHWGDVENQGLFDVVDIAPSPSGSGYWLLHKDGTVDSFGDATPFGDATVAGTMPSGANIIARSIESHPSTQGYWVLLSDGNVQAFNLTNHGSANRSGFTTTEYVASIRRTHTGAGYWIPSGQGIVQAFGDAPHLGNATPYPPEMWVYGLCWDIIPYSESDQGYAVQYADGNLAPFGAFEFFGSIGTGEGQLRQDGNYKDYTDIVRDLLLWAGFYLRQNPQPGSEMPRVYGNLENTGIFSKEDLPQDMFDKKPVFDCIRALKEIVGYVFFIDEEGGARFESPNWWTMGNFKIDGTPLDLMPEIDEKINLTDYSMTRGDTNARSEIIIATQNPYPAVNGATPPKGVLQTRIVPPSKPDLKGMVRPAMWTNGVFTDPANQKVMADLIAMHIWFSRRTSQVTCTANPLIGVNDQVRIYERQSGEVYVHYVRGVQITHDLRTGAFDMTLTTHWMGGSPYGQTPLYYACAERPQGDGYWQVDSNAGVAAYGAAELYAKNIADSHVDWVVAMRPSPTGLGYYTMDVTGRIITYGDAVHQGDLFRQTKDVKDMALTPSGAGYWLVLDDGTVYEFGDAINYGSSPVGGSLPNGVPVVAHAIESHPVDQGYWVLWTDGTVTAHNLTDHGSATRVGFTDTDYVPVLRRTGSGDGYWVASTMGKVQAFGDAVDQGDGDPSGPNHAVVQVWDMLPDYDSGNNGYALQHADGRLDPLGSFVYLGAVGGEGIASMSHPWAIVTEPTYAKLSDQRPYVKVTQDMMKFLQKTASPSANNAVANSFGDPQEPTIKARV